MKDTQIQWHPAFAAAMDLEMSAYRDSLRFDREYNLNVKPLQIDLLVTKSSLDSPIDNEIGNIFKKFNIFEYKDPSDGLNIDVFFKALAYACLFKAYGKTVDAIKETDITITFIRDTRPDGLFQYFKVHGYQVAAPYCGIYYITGSFPFPAQIIVSKELKPERHIWLRALSGKLKKQDIQDLLARILQLSSKADRENAGAILEVTLRANSNVIDEIMGDEHMSEELLEIIQPIIEPRILLREQKALDSGIKTGIKTGIAGAVKMLREMGCEDSKIKTMIMAQFDLTSEEANEYL